jgi:hypothetical protein
MHRILLVAALIAAAPASAHAFCGFYIDGAGKDMFAEATQVVLMRSGTKTVLSMKNSYKGPIEEFAMVVPVPVVLSEDDVKTLPDEVFDRVDTMGSPRLVEYWEQDPCAQRDHVMYGVGSGEGYGYGGGKGNGGVTIEAEFEVGEYQIVILSAKDSTGLDTWLRDNGYRIPDGAEPALRPYVEAGSKFFVAKVNPKKVKFKNKRAMLSPLRFHYDSDEFSLPIRLGLINSAGKQDLIVNILSPSQRYQVANYKNVTIPTNLEVKDSVRKKFGEFYVALFDRTLEKNPGAVVTEYAWDANTCDPCPGPVLEEQDFATLGNDVIGSGGFVLTRLHARYDKDDMKDDLVFEAAPPIVGGREQYLDDGKLEESAREDSYNNFQGRYIIRHRWTKKIGCKNPERGIWGGKPGAEDADPTSKPARNLAFAKRGKVKLRQVLKHSVPELGIKIATKKKPKKKKKPTTPATP